MIRFGLSQYDWIQLDELTNKHVHIIVILLTSDNIHIRMTEPIYIGLLICRAYVRCAHFVERRNLQVSPRNLATVKLELGLG